MSSKQTCCFYKNESLKIKNKIKTLLNFKELVGMLQEELCAFRPVYLIIARKLKEKKKKKQQPKFEYNNQDRHVGLNSKTIMKAIWFTKFNFFLVFFLFF